MAKDTKQMQELHEDAALCSAARRIIATWEKKKINIASQ